MKTNIFDESWRKSVKEEYEADVYNTEKAEKYALIMLSETMELQSRIEDRRIYCPDLDMTVTPRILKLSPQNAVLNFSVYSPKWGNEMQEQSSGLGNNTAEAVAVAVSSFVYSFVDGLVKMEKGENAGNKDTDTEIATIFGGKTHKWRAYFSDVVTIGDAPDVGGAYYYWNKLKKLILKRLGNQKVCYVRLYLDRIKGDITGECRIDDEHSLELSMELVKEVAKWRPKSFASHKAYFFIRQDDETFLPYPYLGEEGRVKLRRKIKTAVDILYGTKPEDNDKLLPDLKKALDDDILAEECYVFMSEMCAESAFRDVRYSEMVEIESEDKGVRTVYKNQLADYRQINGILFELLNEGVFGGNTDDIFRSFVDDSAIKNALLQIKESGKELRGVSMNSIRVKVGENFELR